MCHHSLRHCFRHRFAVNSYTYEFLDLQGAARFYDSYMQLVQTYMETLASGVLAYRHEDLVADFPAVLARICAHLALDLRAEMFDIGRRVREGRVSSPSAVQLRGGHDPPGLQPDGDGHRNPGAANRPQRLAG